MHALKMFALAHLRAVLAAICLYSLIAVPNVAHAQDQKIPESDKEFLERFLERFRNSPEYADDYAARMYAYDVAELPVWNRDGSFDTTVLGTLIKRSVADKKWGKTSLLWSDPKKHVVYITTSAKHHDEIAALLNSLRQKSNEAQ